MQYKKDYVIKSDCNLVILHYMIRESFTEKNKVMYKLINEIKKKHQKPKNQQTKYKSGSRVKKEQKDAWTALRHLVYSKRFRSVQLESIENHEFEDRGWSQMNGRLFHFKSSGKP